MISPLAGRESGALSGRLIKIDSTSARMVVNSSKDNE